MGSTRTISGEEGARDSLEQLDDYLKAAGRHVTEAAVGRER